MRLSPLSGRGALLFARRPLVAVLGQPAARPAASRRILGSMWPEDGAVPHQAARRGKESEHHGKQHDSPAAKR